MKALLLSLSLLAAAPLADAQANHNTTRSNRTAPVAADACDDDCDGTPAMRATDYNSSRSNKNSSGLALIDPDDDGDGWEIVASTEAADDWATLTSVTAPEIDAMPATPTRGVGDPDTTDPTPIYMTLQLAPSVAPEGSRVEVYERGLSTADGGGGASARLAPVTYATVMADGTARLELSGVADAEYSLRVFRADGRYHDGDDLVLRKRPGRDAASGMPTGRR